MAIPNGKVYLLKDVPLSADYEYTIDFKDRDEQYSYFEGFIKYPLTNCTYVRREREYITVERSLAELEDVNYLMFRSTEGERLYFAFVTNKTFVSEKVSMVFYQVDVMQTYAFDYKWKPSYIKQAHVDRWTAEHKPIYSKTDEGLDYGTEYSVESAYRLEQSSAVRWLLVTMVDEAGAVAVGGLHGIKGGTINPAATPFISVLVPLPLLTDGINAPYAVQVETFGNSFISGNYNDFAAAMTDSALGNYVRSISLLSYVPFVMSEQVDGEQITVRFSSSGAKFRQVGFPVGEGTKQFLVLENAYRGYIMGGQTLARTAWNTGLDGSLPTSKQWEDVKKNPYTTERDKRFESKLLCAPYRYNLLSDWRGAPVVYKNEYMTDTNIEVKFSWGITHNAPFRFWIEDYKKDPEGRNTCLSQPVALEFPVISDAYYTYILENKNTIQANLTNAIINAGAGAINGAISGGGMGGAAGAAFGAVSGVVSGGLNVGAMVRSENAKQRDLKTHPDSVINSVDSAFNVVDKNIDVTFYRMRICCENEEIISQIFNMSGYMVNRVEVPNTRSRVRFNYLQTVGANITGSFNQADLLRIKEIYNNGITIWHYSPENFNLLDYSYENIERSLL